MIYTITIIDGVWPTATETCNGSVDRAKAIAIAAVQQGTGSLAEVRDASGSVVFQYPRAIPIEGISKRASTGANPRS
jgi:hypothetical protein